MSKLKHNTREKSWVPPCGWQKFLCFQFNQNEMPSTLLVVPPITEPDGPIASPNRRMWRLGGGFIFFTRSWGIPSTHGDWTVRKANIYFVLRFLQFLGAILPSFLLSQYCFFHLAKNLTSSVGTLLLYLYYLDIGRNPLLAVATLELEHFPQQQLSVGWLMKIVSQRCS